MHYVVRGNMVVAAVDFSKTVQGTVFECGGRKVRKSDHPGWFECAEDGFPLTGRTFSTHDGTGEISADGSSMRVSYIDEDTGQRVNKNLYKR
jgi:hypothetical protein